MKRSGRPGVDNPLRRAWILGSMSLGGGVVPTLGVCRIHASGPAVT